MLKVLDCSYYKHLEATVERPLTLWGENLNPKEINRNTRNFNKIEYFPFNPANKIRIVKLILKQYVRYTTVELTLSVERIAVLYFEEF